MTASVPGRGSPRDVAAGRWDGVPAGVRRMVLGAAAVFGYGTVVHVVQLVGGGLDPYPAVPGALALYFVSLTLLDPLAAVLLLLRRRSGLVLGCAVLFTDAAANGWAHYAVGDDQGVTAGRVGQAVVTLLAGALLAAAPRLWPWLRPARPDGSEARTPDGRSVQD